MSQFVIDKSFFIRFIKEDDPNYHEMIKTHKEMELKLPQSDSINKCFWIILFDTVNGYFELYFYSPSFYPRVNRSKNYSSVLELFEKLSLEDSSQGFDEFLNTLLEIKNEMDSRSK